MSDQPCSTDQIEGCENPVSTTIVVDQGTPPLPPTSVESAVPVPVGVADATLPATGASSGLLFVAFLAVVVGCLLVRAVRRPCGPGRVTALVVASKDLVDDRVPEGSDGVAVGGLVATAPAAVLLAASSPLPVWVLFAVLGVVGLLWWLESHE